MEDNREEKQEINTSAESETAGQEEPTRNHIQEPVEAGLGFRAFMILGLMVLSFLGSLTVARSPLNTGTDAKATDSSSAEVTQGLPSWLPGMGGGDSNKDGIAIVNVYGAIQTESSGSPWQEASGSDAIVKQLRQLGKNSRVKAIVVRLNTPGGTVGASQEIYQELMKLRQQGKKIVASMADVCASGGVYIAAAADKVVANEGTVTGSVGVIFSLANLESLLEKVGVTAISIKSGKFKDIGSMSRAMTDEERALLQNLVDSTYEQFVQAVAKGRNLSLEQVRPWADGSIFNGVQAKTNGLVDEIGSLQDAVELAQKLADLPEPHIIRVQQNPLENFQIFLRNMMYPSLVGKEILRSSGMLGASPLLYLWTGGVSL
ncbi:MAG: signal peptide peptidase SppA [Candidatus Cloacimonetes bacterium]|nr:signal peptide peptidase SppA [Candidatus Cloacimonadota bacterium]